MTKRYFIFFSYNGTNYHGWQNQCNACSVQSVLEEKMSLLFRTPIELTAAGRTDAGVHALLMVAHFDAINIPFTLPQLIFKLNQMLPSDIAVQKILPVVKNAHARFDAILRTYQYKIHTYKNPFLKNLSYYLYGNLDLDSMNKACALLLEYNDFASFCKMHEDIKNTLCKIQSAEWKKINSYEIIFEITANRFLRNMVRAIVGTMIELGQNKITLEQFKSIIESKNRSKAKHSAPACGLYLIDIVYPPELFLNDNE